MSWIQCFSPLFSVGSITFRAFWFPKERLQEGKAMLNLYYAVVITIYGLLFGLLIFIISNMETEDKRPIWA